MTKPFISEQYSVEVITPVHIGAAKESDYLLGADFYYDRKKNEIIFFRSSDVLKSLTPLEVKNYSKFLAAYNLIDAAQIMKKACTQLPGAVICRKPYPFEELLPDIRKHFSTGLGKITLPGSSIKGALRSCIGNFMISSGEQRPASGRDFDALFGPIQNNLMRFLQVTDIELDQPSVITPMKVFSGDVFDQISNEGNRMNYQDAEGQWKHQLQGGHDPEFQESGFVFLYETCAPGAKGKLRLNWAEGLDTLIAQDRKPRGYRYYHNLQNRQWMGIARRQMTTYLEQELAFYQKFRNNDFVVVDDLINQLLEINNQPDSVLIRMGAGTGYHAITGNWKYADHTQTGQASRFNKNTKQLEPLNAIRYKTRKVAFGLTEDEEGELLDFQLPGFIKISSE